LIIEGVYIINTLSILVWPNWIRCRLVERIECLWLIPAHALQHVDGDVKVRIVGDTFGLSVHWLEGGRSIDDLTGTTPSYMDLYEAVRYWIASLDHRVAAHVAMQNAGIFPAGQFVDADTAFTEERQEAA